MCGKRAAYVRKAVTRGASPAGVFPYYYYVRGVYANKNIGFEAGRAEKFRWRWGWS